MIVGAGFRVLQVMECTIGGTGDRGTGRKRHPRRRTGLAAGAGQRQPFRPHCRRRDGGQFRRGSPSLCDGPEGGCVMVDIPATLSALSHTLSLVKNIRELDSSIQQAELKSQMLTIMESLYEAKTALLESKQEIDDLEEQIRKITKDSKKIDELIRHGELYFEGEIKEENARCPRCCEVDSKVISLVKKIDRLGTLICCECDKVFANPFYKRPKRPVARRNTSWMAQ